MSNKWEVIVMKSDCEPWWFFEDWRNNIMKSDLFTDKVAAIQHYCQKFMELKHCTDYMQVKKSTAAFWLKDDLLYCEGCGDDIQIYYGLLLLLNDHPYCFTEEDKTIFPLISKCLESE